MNWLDLPKGALSGGPLVGNFAFNIARYLGCSPLILVGQDLSFKPTGATHVKGMVFGQTDHNYKKNTVAVEGNYEETLLTTRSFEEGIRSLEIQVAALDGLCINATEGGAKIRGTRLMSLKEALDHYCKEPFDPLPKLKQIWTDEKKLQKDPQSELARIGVIVKDSLHELDFAVAECRHGIQAIDSVLEQGDLLPEGIAGPENPENHPACDKRTESNP